MLVLLLDARWDIRTRSSPQSDKLPIQVATLRTKFSYYRGFQDLGHTGRKGIPQ